MGGKNAGRFTLLTISGAVRHQPNIKLTCFAGFAAGKIGAKPA